MFEIDPSDVVHANVKDEVYLRVGDESRRLTYAQRQELLYDKGQASYRGKERGAGARQQLLSDQRFEGPIPLLLLAAREAVQEAQPARRALQETGRFGDVPLIPHGGDR